MIELHLATIAAPPGPLWITGTRDGLVRVGFGAPPEIKSVQTLERAGIVSFRRSPGPIGDAVRSLREYLAGRARTPTAALDLRARTPFARRVLEAVRAVPPGQLRTFDAIARASGSPRAARAVGRVLASNPLPLFVPCHRVIRKSGAIAGYLGGRTWKRFLLDLETDQLALPASRRRRRRRPTDGAR